MLLVAAALRVVLAILLDGEMKPIADEALYLTGAKGWLENGTLETGAFVRPPLYFLFLALVGAVTGDGTTVLAAKLVQCIASCATALPVYRSALRIGGLRAARLAVALLLFDPTLISFSHLLWPETLFLLGVAIVFDGITGLDPSQVRRAIALGAVTGMAMLLKPVFGLFTLVLAASWLRRLGWVRAIHLIAIFGGAAALLISPWVLRNQLRYGGTILLENQGAYNLWSGNAAESPDQVLEQWWEIQDPRERNRVAAERGIDAIRSDPSRFAKSYVRRVANFFGFEYFAVRHFIMRGYPEVSRATLLVCFWLIQAGWVLALLSAALGLGPVLRDPTLRGVVLYGVLFVALVSAMVVTTRFRVPFTFVTAVAGGVGLDRLLSKRIGWRSGVLAIVAISLLALSASRPVFRPLFTGDFETRKELLDRQWIYFRY